MLPSSVFFSGNTHDGSDNEVVLEDDSRRLGEDTDCSDEEYSVYNTVVSDEIDVSNDDEYEKIREKSYIYVAGDMLNPQTEYIGDEVNTVMIVMYRVNTEGKIPFLEFGLVSDRDMNLCYFMEISKQEFFALEHTKLVKGFLQSHGVAYVFICLNDAKPEGIAMMSFMSPQTRFAVVDEIMNTRTVYDCEIDSDVCDFFTDHRHFLFLHDTQYNVYETPCVGYAGVETKNVRFTSVFGVDRSEATAPLGDGIYFTSYANACAHIKNPVCDYLSPMLTTHTNKITNGVVCRFMMFLGKMKVVLNKIEDPVDESDIKREMLNDANTCHVSKMTMRITDHNGGWRELYDSVYVGNVTLDDDSVFETGPLWVIRDHDQHMFLDTHVR